MIIMIRRLVDGFYFCGLGCGSHAGKAYHKRKKANHPITPPLSKRACGVHVSVRTPLLGNI